MLTGAAGDQSGDRQPSLGSNKEQQRLAEPMTSPASEASQGQRQTAPGQDEAVPERTGAAQDQMPAAPLFVAQSPAGKGPAEGWVKKYLAMHPESSEAEALRGANSQLCRPSIASVPCGWTA